MFYDISTGIFETHRILTNAEYGVHAMKVVEVKRYLCFPSLHPERSPIQAD